MKKLIYIFILFSLISCGSFQKSKEKSLEEIKNELKTNIEKKTDSKEENKTLEPVDVNKPMVIYRDGKTDTIWNTRVIYNNTEKVITEKNTTEAKQEEKKQEEKKEKESDNTTLILGVFGIGFLFLLIVIIFIVIYFSNQIKSMIPKINN